MVSEVNEGANFICLFLVATAIKTEHPITTQSGEGVQKGQH